MRNTWVRSKVLLAVSLLWMSAAQGFELVTEKVTENVYALVGEIGPRSEKNLGLNNTLGFIVTDRSVVLVSSGVSAASARLIERAIDKVTTHPVRWVINIGVQDHHWLGNRYFAEGGAKIIALKKTVLDQQAHVDDQLARLSQALKKKPGDFQPYYASSPIDAQRSRFKLDNIEMELIWPGGGHYPGDAVLWLPQQRVVLTGDYVFHDRMLGVQPYSKVADWRRSFEKIAALHPRFVIPGHGFSGSLDKARRDTGDYLNWLVTQVGIALEDWQDIGETVDALSVAPAFQHLKFYDSWHRKNINRTYLELESL